MKLAPARPNPDRKLSRVELALASPNRIRG